MVAGGGASVIYADTVSIPAYTPLKGLVFTCSFDVILL